MHALCVVGMQCVSYMLCGTGLRHPGFVMLQVLCGMFFACWARGWALFVSGVWSVTHASCVLDVFVALFCGWWWTVPCVLCDTERVLCHVHCDP